MGGQLARPDQLAELAEAPPDGPKPEPEPVADPDRVLHDPTYPAGRDEYHDALLEATVVVPTAREVDTPEAVLDPDSPWLRASWREVPAIEAFTDADEFARSHPGQPSVTMPFLLLMLAWPAGHALSINPGGRVRMECTLEEVSVLQRRAVANRG